MCKTPKAPKVEIPDPVILRNPFLDAQRSPSGVVDALRTGRSSLRIPMGSTSRLFTAPTGGNQASGSSGARGNSPGNGRNRQSLNTQPVKQSPV